VSLYFEGFDHFHTLLDTAKIDKDDTTFVTKLVAQMSKHYQYEKDRRDAFLGAMNDYLNPLEVERCFVPSTDYTMDGCIKLNLNGERVITLILEVKAEVGRGGAESIFEAVGYYWHCNPEKKLLPCFIVELVGPHLGIYGAVTVSGKIQVDQLSVTHWLCCQPKNQGIMLQIAKLFKALKMVLQGDYFKVSDFCEFLVTILSLKRK